MKFLLQSASLALCLQTIQNFTLVPARPSSRIISRGACVALHMTESVQMSDSGVLNLAEVSKSNWQLIDDILSKDPDNRKDSLTSLLPSLESDFVKLLKSAAGMDEAIAKDQFDGEEELNKIQKLKKVGMILESLMDTQLKSGRDTLAELLACGEIRKLDNAIGKAQRAGKLDMAFFTVLNMNIQDAYTEASSGNLNDNNAAPKLGSMTIPEAVKSSKEAQPGADRLQILQHIYTRCQEEIEKVVQPGVGLLNKLLRTDMQSIRKNQLRHYLAPQNSVKTPDGTEIPLLNGGMALVPPKELASALSNAVQQIRQVEKAGGADRVTVADLVESCRQIGIEARFALIEIYGENDDIVIEFQDDLQPVFRPGQSYK